MAIKEFTEIELVKYLRRKLGGNTIDVELTEDDFTDAVQDSVEMFNHYKPKLILRNLPVVLEQEKYLLDEYGRGLFECSPGRRNVFDLAQGFGFPIPLEYRIPGVDLEKYEAYLMWQEEANRVYSVEFEWRFDAPYLYVANIPGDTDFLFISYWDDYSLEKIPSAWRDWIKRWSLTCVKETLGEIREKYTQVPSAGGGANLNGSQLKSEAQQEKQLLTEKIEGGRGDLPPTWG